MGDIHEFNRQTQTFRKRDKEGRYSDRAVPTTVERGKEGVHKDVVRPDPGPEVLGGPSTDAATPSKK